MSDRNVVAPMSKFQEDYLQSNSRMFVVGGAAGSSKSHIGLMRHLRFVQDPYYRGFCVRKNSSAIMKSGGLFEAAVDLYGKVYDITPKIKDQKIIFPSGASVTFTHYENDNAQQAWQGLEASNIFVDEGTHFSESHIWWMFSRLRTKANNVPSMWISCNPDVDSYLRKWVDWWVYPETHEKAGLPDEEKNGVIRWALRQGGQILFADSREEMFQKYGKPHLPEDHKLQIKPITFQCLFGTIYDNPWLIEHQPDYLASLEALPELEMQRLLLGNWNAREKDATYFMREWVEEVTEPICPSEIESTTRVFDFAGTLVSDSNPSPDYTTSLRMNRLRDGRYYIDDIRRTRIRVGDWVSFIKECASVDSNRTSYFIPQDPNPAAKRNTILLIRELAENGIAASSLTANQKKLERFRPFSAIAQQESVVILKGCAVDYENDIYHNNDFYYKELEAFTGVRKRGETGHDDRQLCRQ